MVYTKEELNRLYVKNLRVIYEYLYGERSSKRLRKGDLIDAIMVKMDERSPKEPNVPKSARIRRIQEQNG